MTFPATDIPGAIDHGEKAMLQVVRANLPVPADRSAGEIAVRIRLVLHDLELDRLVEEVRVGPDENSIVVKLLGPRAADHLVLALEDLAAELPTTPAVIVPGPGQGTLF